MLDEAPHHTKLNKQFIVNRQLMQELDKFRQQRDEARAELKIAKAALARSEYENLDNILRNVLKGLQNIKLKEWKFIDGSKCYKSKHINPIIYKVLAEINALLKVKS